MFSSICGLSSHSLDIVFCRVEVFDFNEDQFIICIFMDHAFGVIFLLIFIMNFRAVLVPKEMTIVFCIVILKNLKVIWRELTSYYVKSFSLTITFTLQFFTFLLEFFQFNHSVMSGSVTSWIVAHQASLTIMNPQNLLKLTSIESVLPSNHLILCCPLLLPSIFPASGSFPMSQFFASGGQSIGALAFSISPSNKYSGLISFRID